MNDPIPGMTSDFADFFGIVAAISATLWIVTLVAMQAVLAVLATTARRSDLVKQRLTYSYIIFAWYRQIVWHVFTAFTGPMVLALTMVYPHSWRVVLMVEGFVGLLLMIRLRFPGFAGAVRDTALPSGALPDEVEPIVTSLNVMLPAGWIRFATVSMAAGFVLVAGWPNPLTVAFVSAIFLLIGIILAVESSLVLTALYYHLDDLTRSSVQKP